MRSEIDVDVSRFRDRGYLILRDVFTRDEVEEFRRRAFAYRHWKGDLLSHPGLRDVLLDDRILAIAARILGETPVYYGDGCCNFGQSAPDFHKDNADRLDPNAPDWRSPYTQIRFGLYLQDHAWHSGGLRVIPKSQDIVTGPRGRPVNVRARVGDLVVWNMRIDHAGMAVLLRVCPWVYINPARLLRQFPRFLLADEAPDRAAAFFTLGREDAHMGRYIAYLKTRAYAVELFKESVYGPDVWDAVRGKDIKVLDIGDEVRRRLAAGETSLGAHVADAALPY